MKRDRRWVLSMAVLGLSTSVGGQTPANQAPAAHANTHRDEAPMAALAPAGIAWGPGHEVQAGMRLELWPGNPKLQEIEQPAGRFIFGLYMRNRTDRKVTVNCQSSRDESHSVYCSPTIRDSRGNTVRCSMLLGYGAGGAFHRSYDLGPREAVRVGHWMVQTKGCRAEALHKPDSTLTAFVDPGRHSVYCYVSASWPGKRDRNALVRTGNVVFDVTAGDTAWPEDVPYAADPSGKKVETPVTFRGRPWGPEQATGEPDTWGYGDLQTAWASLTPDGQDEWLTLEYAEAVVPLGVDIYETYNPGAVSKVSAFTADGREVVVWPGQDPTPKGPAKGVSRIEFRPAVQFKTRRIKLYIASRAAPGWNEIDAVALKYHGTGSSNGAFSMGPACQWAVSATASSTYAETDGRQPGGDRIERPGRPQSPALPSRGAWSPPMPGEETLCDDGWGSNTRPLAWEHIGKVPEGKPVVVQFRVRNVGSYWEQPYPRPVPEGLRGERGSDPTVRLDSGAASAVGGRFYVLLQGQVHHAIYTLGIQDPVAHFAGRLVRVTGKLTPTKRALSRRADGSPIGQLVDCYEMGVSRLDDIVVLP